MKMTATQKRKVKAYVAARRGMAAAEHQAELLATEVTAIVRGAGGALACDGATLKVVPHVSYTYPPEVQQMAAELNAARKEARDEGSAEPMPGEKLQFIDRAGNEI